MAVPCRSHITSINDLNTSVKCIIQWMASNGQFPDPATVQYNLANFHPDSVAFLARSRINPDNIPAIKEHQKLIQNTNALFWGYALANPVVTLDDLSRLLSNAHSSLGPIYCVPVTKQIFGVREFHPAIISVFMNDEKCDIYRPSVNYIMDEIFQCYLRNRPSEPPFGSNTSTVWWEAVFTRHFLARLHDSCVPNDLVPLDFKTMKFSKLSVYGIRIKGFAALLEALRTSLSPGNFMCAFKRAHGMIENDIKRLFNTINKDFMNESAIANIRRQKPKSALLLLSRNSKALYKKLIEYSQERNFTWPSDFMESLLKFAEFLQDVAIRGPLRPLLHLVLTFADYSSNDFEDIFNRLGHVHRAKELETVILAFNSFFDSFLERVHEESADPQVPWQRLADLEKQLISSPRESLLNLLASTSNQDYTGPKPKCLSVGGPVVVKQPQMDTELKLATEEISDFPRLRNFLRHLTFLAERSVEVLLEICSQNLSIPRSPSAMQTIRCILTDLSISSANHNLLIHPQECRFLTSRRASDVQLPLELCTQRSSVLRLLASCPVLQDPEIWSLWSYCSSSSLASHWGPLEEFLSDLAIDGEMSEKYDLAVVKLIGKGYLRLSTNGTPDDLSLSLAQCTSKNSLIASSAAIKLCDLIIGSALLVSRFIPPAECIQLLSSELISFSEDLTWSEIIKSILLIMPLPLLGVIFSKILHPAMADNLIILEEAEGIEDILKSSSSSSLYDHLVTAVGVVGGQLGWSRWLEAFENRRLVFSSQLHLSLTKSPSLKLIETQWGRRSLLPASEKVSKVADTEVDLPGYETPASKMSSEPLQSVTECREFIENLRRKEFGLGVDLDSEAFGLLQRFESRLNRSLDYLSRQLYGQPGHFILELIQNADDNNYAPGVTPSVHFHLSKSALVVRNNEDVGFTQADISALCDVGLSTKTGNREEKIGLKGIGFKSVFAICDAPEVHSNGFHVRFGCLGDKQRSTTILTPEWITAPIDEDQSAWRTLFRLPFSSTTGQGPSSVVSYARTLLNHHLILFLRRVDSIVFQTSENLPESLSLDLNRASRVLHTLGGPNPSVLKLFTITETRDGLQQTSKWLLLRRRFTVDVEKLSKIAGYSAFIPQRTNITIAIPLSSDDFFPTFPVYAFLPVRNVGFKFLLNADFDLTSSREDIDGASVWNQFLVNQIPDVFESLICSVIQIQSHSQLLLSRSEILGRILECLPLNTRGSVSTLGIFSCLEEQIYEKLSNMPWIPVLGGTRFALPSKVMLGSQNSQNSDLSSPEPLLFRLLVNRLDMQEIDSPFLFSPASNKNESDEVDLVSSKDHRLQKLHRLGVHRISADALIELASTLSDEELRLPGFLYVLLANIDSSLRSFDSQHCGSLSNRSAWQRRCVCNLRRLRIFPLTDGSLVSLEGAVSKDDELLKHRNGLMVPPRPSTFSETLKIAYDKYVRLLSRLGPLISDKAIHPPEACNLSPPQILFSTNDDLSLKLTAANSPNDVINNWIIPHQSYFNHATAENADWFIAAAQIMVLNGGLSEHERVISRLPIVCEMDDGAMRLFSPARDIVFAPLAFLEHLPEKEEYGIMSTLLGNKIKECPISVASSEYFDSVDCIDDEIRERWQNLFSIARLSTIQTLRHQKYHLKAGSPNLPVLPDNHPLRLSPTLAEISNEVNDRFMVEDWSCPGLESLILPWIEKMSTFFESEEIVMMVCKKILSLLDRNWKQNFESRTYAIARSLDSNSPIVLGASTWLQALRTRTWLATSSLEKSDQTIFVAATDSKKSALSITFTASPAIYSPIAFEPTEGSPSIPLSLLNLVCHICKPLKALDRPLNPNFLSALGIKQSLDEQTFKSLMDYLYDKKDQLPCMFSPESMIQVYLLAQHVLRDSPVDALRRLFSSAILVPCSDTRKARKKRRMVGSLGSSEESRECPIYCLLCDYRSAGNLKRTFPKGVTFHIVSADRTCWQLAKLPPSISNPESENDNQEVLVKVPIPDVNPTSPKPPRFNFFESRVELCKVYKNDCKSFFCDILKVPLTSSLSEMLSLRPFPPKFQSTAQWQVAQETFGRTLGAWYALIYQCLEKKTVNCEQMDQLRNFPLLYDMAGAWRTPCNLSLETPFASEDKLIFCWSAVDLAGLLPRKCVLGHCLDILAANADETVSLSLGAVPDSHSLLLDLLGLPVLEKSVSVNLNTTTASQAPNPSKKLDASLKLFRLLTNVWLASTNAKSSRPIVSEFISTPKIGSEAFLVRDLTLRLQLLNSTFGWTVPKVPCRFCSRSFYVDSKFDSDLGINTDEDEVALLVGGRETIREKVLIELTRAVFPYDLRNQLLLLNFSNGLLSLRFSLLNSGLSSENLASHLRAFFISHGVPSGNRSLNDLLGRLTSGALPTDITNVKEASPVRRANVSAITAHIESPIVAPRRPSTQTGDNNTGVGCYTRFQTPMFEAIAAVQRNMLGASKANSLRSNFGDENILMWNANSEETSDFFEIGRKGEETVYENYLKRIKEGREFDFATGHPDLGPGRLIAAEWVNGNGESREPYDIIVYLEVKGSIDNLDPSVNEEVIAGVIKRSPNSKGVLRVGPIFVEVKSTRVTSATEAAFKERADLFEISLAEASYARTIGWRYHIARFRLIRDEGRSEILHIPNLALALSHDPQHFKIYVGMKS